MIPLEERRKDFVGVGIVAALIALAIAFGAQRGQRAVPVTTRAGDVTTIVGSLARWTLVPTSGRLEVGSIDGRSRVDFDMSLVVDGLERPLAMRRGDVRLKDRTTLVADFPIEIGDERATGTLEVRLDGDLVLASVTVSPDVGSSPHAYALRVSLAPEGRSVFVPQVGEVTVVATLEARTVVVDDDIHPFAVVSTQGVLSASEIAPDLDQAGSHPRLVITTKSETSQKRVAGVAAGKPARLDIGVLVGGSSQQIWGRLYRLLRAQVGRVSGVVTGTRERAHVVALDEEGRPQLRAVVDAQGRFTIEAPQAAVQWYAALEAVHISAPVRFTPGTAWDLKLDVSPGGELAVKVIDADTRQPLLARLIVKGIDGTIDPSFGPDYRSSGAGPLMDLVSGAVTTPLPAGRYRIAATKGIEYSIDADTVEIASGHTREVDLELRRVVATPNAVGCDLHVHARPSFDSPVTPEDRVISLVSAGVDFAVPTEHNLVGDYGPALDVLKLHKQLAFVHGVEVTTYNPRFGHFGVFPYPPGGVPPYRGTNAAALFVAAHRGDPNRVVQVNHPRLPQAIGYFQVIGFDPKSGRMPAGMRTDFDTLEVYNGYDLANRPRVEAVLDDWYALLNLGKRFAATGSSDSHRIQYQWAGYPRTYANVDPGHANDTKEIVAAIKKGKSFVTSGPIIDLELFEGGRAAHPGDEIAPPRAGGALVGKLRVRAAPWIDVTSVEIFAGVPGAAGSAGTVASVFKTRVPTVPTKLGKEAGSLEEAAARTIRLDVDLALKPPEGARWIVAVVKGERTMDDALPFMPIQPLAFTNPVWLAR
jgi:hypothetical protein